MYLKKKNNAYGKYLSYATPIAYVAYLEAQVFKFPWRVIFGRFLPAGEQKPKLGGAKYSPPPPGGEKSVLLHSKYLMKSVQAYKKLGSNFQFKI